MTALAVATAVLALALFVALRRVEPSPPPAVPLSPELTAAAQRMSRVMAQAGVSFAQFSAAAQRAGKVLGLAGDQWMLGMHAPVPPLYQSCRFDGKRWPCADYNRLAERVRKTREELGLPPETVGTHR